MTQFYELVKEFFGLSSELFGELGGFANDAGEVAKNKVNQFCIGFALEDSAGIHRAKRKLERKNCDLVVLNSPESIGSDLIRAALIFKGGKPRNLGRISKKDCAKIICQATAKHF